MKRNDIYINYKSQYYLSHHGILGQKWGVRRYQNKDGSLTKAGKQKRQDENDSLKKGLTDKQKKAIKIGAAVVGTALVAYGGYKLYQSGTMDKLLNSDKLKNGLYGGVDTIQNSNMPKKMKTLEPLSDTISKVNPLYGNSNMQNNCTSCGIASSLRQLGMNVTAKSTGGKPQPLYNILKSCFKDIDIKTPRATTFGKSQEDASRMLKRIYGDNAKGVCGVDIKRPTGTVKHVFNWTIDDGVVTFFDSQNRGKNDVSAYWKIIDNTANVILARLDNAEPIYEEIKNIVTYEK